MIKKHWGEKNPKPKTNIEQARNGREHPQPDQEVYEKPKAFIMAEGLSTLPLR